MILTIGTKDRKFTLEEANQTVKILYTLTQEASTKVKKMVALIENSKNDQARERVENEINQVIEVWQSKVEKLGAHPKGLWLADFDSGSEYFCWKFPETEIQFTHGYNEGFMNRKSCSCTKK